MSLSLSILLSVCIICGTVFCLIVYITKSKEKVAINGQHKRLQIELIGVVRNNFKEIKFLLEKLLPKKLNTDGILSVLEKYAEMYINKKL